MFDWLKKKEHVTDTEPRKVSYFSTHAGEIGMPMMGIYDALSDILSRQPKVKIDGAQDDSSSGAPTLKITDNGQTTLSEALMMWYVSQGFIGHQLAGILAQNWLIEKACSIPAKDAIRKGYSVATIDGDDLPEDAIKLINRYDRAYKLNDHMREFVRKGRIFGIRIALFKVESTDLDYYEKPFNIDGVTPNSYKGIVQLDPYWCAPELDLNAASKPDSLHFYEPTYWIINGKRHHRSHLVIFRNAQPVDMLKPMYLYGGIPVPQQIMERVYAAERVANEAPQLAQTKRTNVWLTDMEAFSSKGDDAISAMNQWTYYRDNFGVKLGDKEADEFQQYDTSLADLDSVIMTQYQIVAAAANIPATKLLGTQPKGFNSSGNYEESSYHEELETIQTHYLSPLLNRHHALIMRSFVVPKMLEMKDVQVDVVWKPLDSPTAQELAQTNLAKAQVGAALIASGAISSEDERKRIAMDKDSGYHGLGVEDMPDELEDEEPND